MSQQTLCKFYGTVKGCKYGNFCNFKHEDRNIVLKSWSLITNDISQCTKLRNNYKKKLKRRRTVYDEHIEEMLEDVAKPKSICILKSHQEPIPKLNFINLYVDENRKRVHEKLVSSNNSSEHIIYISKIYNQCIDITNNKLLNRCNMIKIITPDLLPILQTEHIIYPKISNKCADRNTQIEIIRTNTSQLIPINSSNVSLMCNSNKVRMITVLYIQMPNDPDPIIRDMTNIKFDIGNKIDVRLIYLVYGCCQTQWSVGTIIDVKNKKIQIHDVENDSKKWMDKMDDNIAPLHQYTLPFIEISTSQPPRINSNNVNVLHHKTNFDEFIIICCDQYIHIYEIANKIWKKYAIPNTLQCELDSNHIFVTLDSHSSQLYVFKVDHKYNKPNCGQFNIVTHEWTVKKVIGWNDDFRKKGYVDMEIKICFIPFPMNEVHIIETGEHYQIHWRMLENDESFNLEELYQDITDYRSHELRKFVWMDRQQSLLQFISKSRSCKVKLCKVTHPNQIEFKWDTSCCSYADVDDLTKKKYSIGSKTFISFESILFFVTEGNESNQEICSLDMLSGKIYKTQKYLPWRKSYASEFTMISTDKYDVHFINFDEKIHRKVSILDMIPKELMNLYICKYYNPLLIYGFFEIKGANYDSYDLPKDVAKLILAYFSPF